MNHTGPEQAGLVEPRDLPWPYKAMLALCSDLDETPGAEAYLATSRYLNTTERTPFGTGVGLEVGNTLYFYMDASQFSYWNATEAEREAVRDLVRSGHVDCIHSFGDTATRREQVQATLEHLEAAGCRMQVWIDHAVAVTNFGADIMQGEGDLPGSPAYHADLTFDYGVRYVWRGRVSSMHGQDAPPSVAGIWRPGLPAGSLTTLGKETAKRVLAAVGSAKYAMHRGNRLLRDVMLRDGRRATEFLRSNPHPLGVSAGDNAAGLAAALSDTFLDRLVRRRAKAIVYTHLGKRIDPRTGFPAATRAALEKLAARVQREEVLVATTRRVLDFARLMQTLSFTVHDTGDALEIRLGNGVGDLPLDGLGFRVPRERDVRLLCRGREIETRRHDYPDGRRAIVYLPWRRLSYAH